MWLVKVQLYICSYMTGSDNNRSKIIVCKFDIINVFLILHRSNENLPTGSWLIVDMEQSMSMILVVIHILQ